MDPAYDGINHYKVTLSHLLWRVLVLAIPLHATLSTHQDCLISGPPTINTHRIKENFTKKKADVRAPRLKQEVRILINKISQDIHREDQGCGCQENLEYPGKYS